MKKFVMGCCVVCVRAGVFAVVVVTEWFALFVLSAFAGVTCSVGFGFSMPARSMLHVLCDSLLGLAVA